MEINTMEANNETIMKAEHNKKTKPLYGGSCQAFVLFFNHKYNKTYLICKVFTSSPSASGRTASSSCKGSRGSAKLIT